MTKTLLLTGLLTLLISGQSVADNLVQQGKYLYHLSNCYGCHTDTENDGKELAGGRALQTEFGLFYSPNITADKETGIGLWSEQDFAKALRSGLSPEGVHYYPAFPYISYQNMSDSDIKALRAYIFSLKPINQQNKKHQLKWYLSRLTLPIWKSLNGSHPNEEPENIARGDYLINTLGHCNECHTPRNIIGILQIDQRLSGNEQLSAPDISPDSLKDWDHDELVDLLTDGALPDGDYVSDHMAEVVEFSTSRWTPEDLEAAIRYLTKN